MNEATHKEDTLYLMLVEYAALVARLKASETAPETVRLAQEHFDAMHSRLARIAEAMDGDREALEGIGVEPGQLDRAVEQVQANHPSIRAARLRLLLHPDVIEMHRQLFEAGDLSTGTVSVH